MKILLVTVAGCSTRFSASIGNNTLKCIYYKKNHTESLLYNIINQPVKFDKYIIVGGYKFNELENTINSFYDNIREKIVLVNNPYFKEYGSGYSLYCGLKKALEYNFDEILFTEGDLFVDSESFKRIYNSPKSVITSTSDPIKANKSVAFYFDKHNIIRYIYDTHHNFFTINEPFLSIYNSGQIWKFNNSEILKHSFNEMNDDDWKKTNLIVIEKYFRKLKNTEYDNILINNWINCNTIEDFKNIIKFKEKAGL